MEKRALHEVVKRAAHNAYAIQQLEAARKEKVKATVKTAAAAVLRKEDLKGALLSVVHGNKSAGPLRLPGRFFSVAGEEGLLSALRKGSRYGFSRLGKGLSKIDRSIESRGILGSLWHGMKKIPGRATFEGTPYMKSRSGFRGLLDRLTGNRLDTNLAEMGIAPKSEKAVQFMESVKNDPELANLSTKQLRDLITRENSSTNLQNYLKTEGANAATSPDARRIAELMRREMNASRRNVALSTAGLTGLGAYGLSGDSDYDLYRY